jgi:hypothetical protein
VSDTAQFSTGLLNPDAPVPSVVKGQIERRYNVYRNNVTVGLIRALEANFPAVRRLLGDDYFAGFARAFAQRNPPRSPVMFAYGEGFPAALKQDADLASYPYLADVAQMEMFWRETYHAADHPCLPPSALLEIAPDLLFERRFEPHPALRLLSSDFAVHDIFVANRAADHRPVVNPAVPQGVLLSRPHLDVIINLIGKAQYEFFSALAAGETLAAALETSTTGEDDFDLPGTLALLVQSGGFSNITETRPI